MRSETQPMTIVNAMPPEPRPEMRSSFGPGMARDLRTPLTVILGITHMLRRQWDRTGDLDPSQIAQALGSIGAAAVQMNTLIGIPPADLPHVFDDFCRRRRVPDSAPGTGLGLAIVRRIVIQHGGPIALTSEEGSCH